MVASVHVDAVWLPDLAGSTPERRGPLNILVLVKAGPITKVRILITQFRVRITLLITRGANLVGLAA